MTPENNNNGSGGPGYWKCQHGMVGTEGAHCPQCEEEEHHIGACGAVCVEIKHGRKCCECGKIIIEPTERSCPMGVSQWAAMGKKYHYDDYFGIIWPKK